MTAQLFNIDEVGGRAARHGYVDLVEGEQLVWLVTYIRSVLTWGLAYFTRPPSWQGDIRGGAR